MRRWNGDTPLSMRNPKEYDSRSVREALVRLGGPDEENIIRYAYRPFDTRWLYWEAREKLVDRPRPEYKPHAFEGNLWLSRRSEIAKGFYRTTSSDYFSFGFPSSERVGSQYVPCLAP